MCLPLYNEIKNFAKLTDTQGNTAMNNMDRTTVGHDISDRMLAAGPETAKSVRPTRCLGSPRRRACQVGRNGCIPNTRRPRSPRQTLGRCSYWDRCSPGEPSRLDTRIYNQNN